MPQLIVRGMQREDVLSISRKLVDELQSTINCPREYFTIEVIGSEFIFDGAESAAYPFIQLNWFDRGQEVQDQVAETITRAVQSKGYENVDVFFVVLDEKKYYENGKHF